MNYYELLNSGVKPSGNLDFLGIVKWILGLVFIFVLVQNYWELHTSKIYIYSFHRFKSKSDWLLRQTAKVMLICMVYSGIMLGINLIISEIEFVTLIRLWLLYGLFVFNMNYIFCIMNLDSKIKLAVWLAVFGTTSVICSLVSTRQYWNISSYGMLFQQTGLNDYTISLCVNIVALILMVMVKLICFRRRIGK